MEATYGACVVAERSTSYKAIKSNQDGKNNHAYPIIKKHVLGQ